MDPSPGSRYTGFPNQSEAEAEEGLDLTKRFIAHPAATYFMRMGAPSLVGIGILPGDTLIVDRSLDPHDGDVVVAIVDGRHVAAIWRSIHGRIRLEVACPGMAPYVWGEGCEVWGVATGELRHLRRTR